MATIEINGQKIEAEAGSMLIRAADAAGIYIPRFCYHDKLSIAANCRMCLVEVENSPKPLPACATPITDGMKVETRSEQARAAQKGTMEFLLINHPLDCPICDQGGECELQDLSVGYGKDISRFSEGKRVVLDKNLGSLISTDMTRCIHCTRCVRFGQEIAGIMELGMVNRGEHSEIMTFMEQAVCSEMSGNVIDLCPVGALTSKPFRFRARSWEMQNHHGIAVHDTVGSNTIVQTLRGEVLRVLPRENQDINEEWLSDRDRFSYTANNSEQRLTTPMLKIDGEWKEADWHTALDNVSSKLKKIVDEYGADSIGALASPTSTLEEFSLLAKLMRGLGSQNMDYRLRQQDFRADGAMSAPLLGDSIASLEQAKTVLLIGSNIRKEQPILATRLRKAAKNGASVNAINSTKFDFALPLQTNIAVSPAQLVATLARLVVIVSLKKQVSINDVVEEIAKSCDANKELDGLADSLIKAGSHGQIIVGSMAQMDANYSLLVALATVIGNITDAKSGRLEEGNAAAAWQASFLPFSDKEIAGKNTTEMLNPALKACLLFNIEPSLDCIAGNKAVDALRETGMVIHVGCYRSEEIEELAHVMLPLASVTESDGTHVNCEGNMQSWKAVVHPQGDAKPGWKVLRVLANYLELDGFDYTASETIRDESSSLISATTRTASMEVYAPVLVEQNMLACISHLSLYRVDTVTRRSQPLQQTLDNPPAAAGMHPDTLASMGIDDGITVELANGDEKIDISVYASTSIPLNCVLLPTAMRETAALGSANWLEVKSHA
ncbi:MAG TPA: NADH-quinone oxidoreductase subunit G [Gammaproteobacteria bacterium]|nr:NADH-quinone oxidoreductase subunit G [Gammaproteobacteria bacterium]